ncbi:hypothetical protein JQN58_19570 [Aneurinibacillus sp. BA2021]|nr:hypothetical protein [Aneurinibacillus sp. BA2021]
MVPITPGKLLLEEPVGDWQASWTFGGFINETTITIIYTAHRAELVLGRGITSYSSNYFYQVQAGTEVQLPHTEKKTYVARILPSENTIYFQKEKPQTTAPTRSEEL